MTTDSLLLEPGYSLETLRAVVRTVEANRRTCIRCTNFDELLERCKLVDQRPPARVIAYGCPKFTNDDIPF